MNLDAIEKKLRSLREQCDAAIKRGQFVLADVIAREHDTLAKKWGFK